MTERGEQVGALGRLTFEELGRAVGGIGALHRAIADRAFAGAGPAATPARVMHDAIAGGVYGALRGVSRATGRGAEQVLGRRAATELSASPSGAGVIAAVNGLIGDALERQGSALHEPMSVRVGGRAVALEPGVLAAAFPKARGRLVVFVHGLMEPSTAGSCAPSAPAAATASASRTTSRSRPSTSATTPGATSPRTARR